MEFRMIQEFVVLADVRNYARAAEELYMTQATLSRHINALEKEFGHLLFNRTTRKVELTLFGEDFLKYARQLCQTWQECQDDLFSDERRNSLVIGISAIILEERDIKERLAGFSMTNPDLNVELVSDDDEARLIERMKRHDLDTAVLREPVGISDSFRRVKLYPAEPLCLLLPSDHPYADNRSVDLNLLKDETFLLPPESSYSYKLFIGRCRELGFEPKVRSSIRGQEIARKMTRNRIGIPVMSRLAATGAADEKLRIVEIDPPIMQQIDMVCPSAGKTSSPLKALLEYMKHSQKTISISLT